jgi:Ran GTPase-activating protein (RanGAP) involved in mRNA processing and transport
MPEEVMRAVAELPQLARLNTLDLTETGLGPGPLEFLAASEHVSRLRTIRLTGNQIGTAGIRALAASDRLAGLTELDLEDAHLAHDEARPAALEVLAAAPRLLSRLVSLDLGSNGLDDRCVRLLARSPYAAGLKVLRLGLNPVTAVGVRLLVESPYLHGLQELGLNCFHLRLDRAVVRALGERFGADYRVLRVTGDEEESDDA